MKWLNKMNINSTSLPLYCPLHCASVLHSTHCSTLLFSVTLPLQFCKNQNKTDLECYYEPLSRCTIQDALAGDDGKQVHIDSIPHVGDIVRGEEYKIMLNYLRKKHNLFCCHNENMFTSYFFPFTVAFPFRFTL